MDQSERAVAVGLDYLRSLGGEWSPHPTEDVARREYDKIWSELGERAIEDLIDLPVMTDPVSLATMDVLTKLGAPAGFTDANLYTVLFSRAVNLSLARGNGDASCFAYEWLGAMARASAITRAGFASPSSATNWSNNEGGGAFRPGPTRTSEASHNG
jgi:predicted ATPase